MWRVQFVTDLVVGLGRQGCAKGAPRVRAEVSGQSFPSPLGLV